MINIYGTNPCNASEVGTGRVDSSIYLISILSQLVSRNHWSFKIEHGMSIVLAEMECYEFDLRIIFRIMYSVRPSNWICLNNVDPSVPIILYKNPLHLSGLNQMLHICINIHLSLAPFANHPISFWSFQPFLRYK